MAAVPLNPYLPTDLNVPIRRITITLWPGRIRYYKIHRNLNGRAQHIMQSLNELNDIYRANGIDIRYRRTTRCTGRLDTVLITNGPGCSADLGYQENGVRMRGVRGVWGARMILNAAGCLDRSRLHHEAFHVEGVVHSHEVQSRDSYIRVNRDNVGGNLDQYERLNVYIRRPAPRVHADDPIRFLRAVKKNFRYGSYTLMHYTVNEFGEGANFRALPSYARGRDIVFGAPTVTNTDVQNLKRLRGDFPYG